MGKLLDPLSMELLTGPSFPQSNIAPEGFRVPSGATLGIAGDGYEGASRISVELASYRPETRSADQDIRPAKRMADARSRDLSRNDAKIQSGINIRKDGIVGAHFMCNPVPNSLRLFGKEDTKWEDEHSDEVADLFYAAAEGDGCWLDAGRRMTLTEMVRLAIEQHTVHGEVLATAEWIRTKNRPFNTAIQMVDVDRLSTPYQIIDPKISMGVEMGFWDEPVAYHIRLSHPSDYYRGLDATNWKRVPAEKDWGRKQVIHIYEQHRPGQTRGIGTMVAAIPEMKMSRQFREIVLQNAILNATYAATVESDLDPAAIFARLGGTDFSPQRIQEALEGYMSAHYQVLGSLVGGSNNLKMGGVKIPHLPPGSKLHLQGAGQGGPLGSEFEAALDRGMAAAFGVSYEQFSKDYTKTNYSSGKMASVETYKAMMSIKRAIADRFASTVYRLWYEEALNKGMFTTVRRNMPSFYEGFNADWYCAAEWVGASRGQVDELKETQAAILRVNNGLSTRQDEAARLGKNWRRIFAQMKKERDWADFYGVLPEPEEPTDTTNQQNAASGTKREAKTTGMIPSAGTAAALFMDDTHPEEPDDVANQ